MSVRIQLPFGLEPILPIPSGCVVDVDLLERWILCDRGPVAGQATDTLTVEFSTDLSHGPELIVGYGVAQNSDFPALDQLLSLNIEPSE